MQDISKRSIIPKEQTIYCVIGKDKLAHRPGKKTFRE